MSWEDFKKEKQQNSSWEEFKKRKETLNVPLTISEDNSLLNKTQNFINTTSNKISDGISNTFQRFSNRKQNNRITDEQMQNLALQQAKEQTTNSENKINRKISIDKYNQSSKEEKQKLLNSIPKKDNSIGVYSSDTNKANQRDISNNITAPINKSLLQKVKDFVKDKEIVQEPAKGNVLQNIGGSVADAGLNFTKGVLDVPENLSDLYLHSIALGKDIKNGNVKGVADELLNAKPYGSYNTISQKKSEANVQPNKTNVTDIDIYNSIHNRRTFSADELRNFASNENYYNLMGLQKIEDKVNDYSYLGNASDEIFRSIGYTAGMAVAGAPLSETVGLPNSGNIPITLGKTHLDMPILSLLGGSASSLNETYQSDKVNGTKTGLLQTWIKSINSGLTEGFTEGMFGMYGVGGSSIEDSAQKYISQKIAQGAGQTLASLGLSATGEATGELVSYMLNYITDHSLDTMFGTNNASNWNWEDVGKSMASAFASTLISQGSTQTIQSIANKFNSNELYNNAINISEQQLGRKLNESERKEVKTQIEELQKQVNNNLEAKMKKTNDATQFDKKTNNKQVEKLIGTLNANTNLQQNVANNQNTFSSQQIIPTIQNNAQNGISEQKNSILNNKDVPMLNYQYEKSDNAKINNLRQDASKYFNNSDQARNYVNMLEQIITDKNVDIRLDDNLKTLDGKMANGSYSNGVITINPNSTKSGEFIAIHELTHAIGTDSMRNIIETYRKSNTEFNTAMENLLQNYNSTELTDEALSDVSAQLFGNQEFITNISQSNPNIFKRIYNEIKYLWHQFRGYKNQNQFIDDLYYKWTQAYNSNNKLNEASNYSIAGKEGMTNAIKADTRNLALERNYNKAQQMQKSGIDNETIRQNTGWFQDRNGDWKFEFSDKDMSLKNIKLEKDKTYKLGDLLEHDTLFTVYPELANYNVSLQNMNRGGSYNRKNDSIKINNNKLNSILDFEGTLIHEIQHAIQKIENFEGGGSSKNSKLAYFNMLGEIEADDTKRRLLLEKTKNDFNGNITAPESSKANPKHSKLESYLKNRSVIDKMKDGLYNYFNKKGLGDTKSEKKKFNNYDLEINKNEDLRNQDENSRLVVGGGRVSSLNPEIQNQNIQESENNSGSFSMQDNKGRKLSEKQIERYKNVSDELKDGNGNLKTYYHGTQRADRVGNYFDPEKATSGPMAFFTDNEKIATSYSNEKTDTSLSREYDTEKDLFKINGKSLDEYWDSLSNTEKQRINEKGRNVGFDEDWENIVYDEKQDSFSGQYDYYLKNETSNNGIEALYKVFVEDGNLYGEDVKKFQKVLELAGLKNIDYLDPYKIDKKVYEVYLNVKRPFNTSNISSDMINQLRKASKSAKTGEQYSADIWDKSNISPEKWIERFDEDLANETSHAWTTIPDWVTEVLKKNGYDGISDTGGKNGGQEHQVIIPFYSEQIKNVDNTNPTDNPDIRYSRNNQKWQTYLNENFKSEGTKTNLEKIKNIAPIAKNNKDIKAPIAKKQQNNVGNVPYRTTEQIVNDKKISDLDAIKEESNKVNTPTIKEANKAVNQLENNISPNVETPTSPTIDLVNKKRSKEKASLKEIKDTLAQKFVNKGHYIDKLAQKTGNKNLTYLYDRTMNTFNEAQISIGDRQVITNEKGTDIEVVGKSIMDIFSEADNSKLSNEFDDYLLNKHNVSRYAYEKGVFGQEISATDSQKIVKSYEERYPEFIKWSKEVSNYNDNNLKDLVRNGLVSKETYNKLREMYSDYVPTFRDITENMAQYQDDSVGGNTLKKATESSKNILSIKESMAEQTLAIKKAIRVNKLGLELYKTLGKESKVNESVSGIDFDPVAIQTLAGDVITKAKDGTNTFMIFRDGEMTEFKISDELYSAFRKDTIQNKINNSEVARTLLTPVEKLSKVQRELLTTYSVGFAFNNPIKDFQDAVFNTKYSSTQFLKNYTKALYNIGTDGFWYQNYKNNGGTANTYFDYEKGILPNKNKRFGDSIKAVNEILEQAPRLAEYISTIENGGNIDEALYNAADITTNFKRGGDVTKAINKYGANFLNASVQGLDKFYRNLSGQNGWKGYASLAVKAIVWQVAPAVLNGLLLGDDDDYEDLPEYTKDNYFLFKIGDGKFFRIPKGRISSVVGGIARRALETTEGKKVDWKALIDTTINQMAPNNPLKDNIIAPILQASSNKSWYGGEIVSSRLQKLPVAEQADESTDKLSKFLGEKLNISPKKINYVLDQYSGGVGDIILPMLTPQAENNILEDKFTTNAVMKNKHVSEYYSLLEDLEKNKNSEKATDTDKLKYMYLSGSSKELGELYQQKREIQNSDLSDKEKKLQVREVQKQINEIVEEKLENVDSIKQSGDTATVGGEKYYKYKKEWKKLSDEEAEKTKGISLNTYANYQNKVAALSDEKKKKSENVSQKDRINILVNANYTANEKDKIYSQIINKDDDTYQILKKLDSSKNIINQYLNYLQTDLKADREDDGTEKGKAIYGSKKQKVYNYINSIDSNNMSYVQRLYLTGINTTLSTSDKKQIFTLINESKSLTKSEKLESLDKLQGFTVYKDGKVTW